MSTIKIEIEIPSEFAVMSRGIGATLDLSKLPAEVIAQATLHGFKQKISDAAAGAKSYAEENEIEIGEATSELMETAVKRLLSDGWTAARSGGSADPLAKHIRAIIRALIKMPANAEKAAEYKALPDAAAKNAWLDKMAADSPSAADIRTKAQSMADEEAKAKAAQQKLVADIAI